MRRRTCIAALAFAALANAAETVDLQRQVHSILSDKCFTCHGPDEQKRMAGLRLDTKDGAAKTITPGDPAKSRLYQRVSAEKPAMRMPPPGAGELTPAQVAVIRKWIEQGAAWKTHWAFTQPQRPELPQVKDAKWPGNAIDNFILARLEREGLRPSAPADKITLLRRVTFDLTGLPPTPAQIRSFLDDKSPDAYEKRVDELLASPHYGERMAMHWLDLARYADTHGYHIDSHRDMWPWRDWVINAFNTNMSYRQFTIEQLAGDLLPNPTREKKVATGFNRNHMINFEGGAIPEEYQNEYVVDRVEVASTVWLGMTMGCARCHDHKYDPIKQKDFYQFGAFFNTIPEKGLDGRNGNAEPFLQLPDAVQEKQLEELETNITVREKTLKGEELSKLITDWETSRTLPEAPRDGLLAHYTFDGSLADTSGAYRRGRILQGEVPYADGPIGRAAEFGPTAKVEFDYPRDARSVAFWMRFTGRRSMPILTNENMLVTVDDAERVPDLKRGAYLFVRTPAGTVRTKERVLHSEWLHVFIDAAGPTVRIDGEPAEVMSVAAPAEIVDPEYRGQLDDLRWYSRALTEAEVHDLAVDEPVRALLWDRGLKRSKQQSERLRDYFLTYDAPGPLRKTYGELKTLQSQKARLDKQIPTVMVMSESDKPRETFVLGRGDYRNKGEKVSPDVPGMLPPLPAGKPHNRLTLAEWLVDPEHPLAARVAVNRFWQMYFGYGIVKTAEDFGSQGEAPVHPELLDWLATEFVRTGWDVKAMQRLIVTSSAYRQSSKVTPALLEKDPENRLLARGPRFRLPAEMVRDNALAVSGLLVDHQGGPSVLPYSPKGLWEDIAYGDVFSAQSYEQDHGDKLYRRSLYTFWKRTAPPATLGTFDAPDREKCVARRALTNTPLQALALMNDPTFVESARRLAERSIEIAGNSDRRRIAFAFEQATGRKPEAKEAKALEELARAQVSEYRKSPQAAHELLSVGEAKWNQKIGAPELAAWTTVASAILSLDEVITKE